MFKKKCLSCGRNNPSSAKTCGSCGTSFDLKRTKDLSVSSEVIPTTGQSNNPQTAEDFYKQGFVYQKQRKVEQAIANFDQAFRIDPQYAKAYSNRGFAYLNTGQYKQAIVDCTRAIELDISDTVVHLNRGVAYRLQGDKVRALADFRKVLNSSGNPQEIRTAKREIKEISKSE
jgi:tetratricopeptide (TPR) repeat protein